MNKQDYQEKMRKIKWATEQKSGKKMGKKGLMEAQKMVMEMTSGERKGVDTRGTERTPFLYDRQTGENPYPLPNWKERKPKAEPIKMTVDLTSLVGKNFNTCRIK